MKYTLLIALSTSLLTNINGQSNKRLPWCTVGNSSGQSRAFQQNGDIITPNSTSIFPANATIVIPVIFHVVYNVNNAAAENISNSRIQETLAAINADFTNMNLDGANVPNVWQPLRANVGYQLRLACIDPAGNTLPEQGVVRVSTSHGEFQPDWSNGGAYFEPMISAQGGHDAWPTNTYLNIWICNIANDGGFSALPGLRFNNYIVNGTTYPGTLLDGIALDYTTIGNPSSSAMFSKGRVGSHELGHWLGLWHTFQQPCTGIGDEVSDTPPQQNDASVYFPTSCPPLPYPVQTDPCTTNPNGIMYMNQMDYMPDECRIFFTTGQRTRARNYFKDPVQGGFPESRFPFVQNYFSFKNCPVGNVVPVNHIITINMNNPACMPVTYQVNGPVTILQQKPLQLVLQVTCGTSGSVDITASTSCYLADLCSFTFTDPSCEAWPKVYECGSKEIPSLHKGSSGNIFLGIYSSNILNNQNHTGVLPGTTSGKFLLQYNGGVTSWVNTNMFDVHAVFPYNNGNLRAQTNTSYPNYDCINGATGLPCTPPASYFPNSEVMLAESSAGNFISNTLTVDGINVYSPTGLPTSITGWPSFSFFNQTTNRLYIYVARFPGNFFHYYYEVYDLNGGILNLVSSHIDPSFDNPHIHVDNQDNVYDIYSGVLYIYNHFNNSVIPAVITGLNNSNLKAIGWIARRYTDNQFLLYNQGDQKLYLINTQTMTAKSISTTNLNAQGTSSGGRIENYAIDGDNLYLTGSLYNQTTATIGAQQINAIGGSQLNYNSTFLTKVSISGDLSKASYEGKTIEEKSNIPFTIRLFPNPVTNTFRIMISEKEKSNESIYFVSVFDPMKNKVLKIDQYKPGNSIYVSSIKTGVYYIEIMNKKGEKAGAIFTKL